MVARLREGPSAMVVINGAKRNRPGVWILDGIDPETQKRRWWTFRTKTEAEAERDRMGPRRRQAHDRPTLPVNMTVDELADRWLKEAATTHQDKPRTAESYTGVLRTHVRPRLGRLKVREVTREDVKALLLGLLEKKKARGTVRLVLAVVRALFGHAVEAHVILVNPAGDRLGQKLQLFETKRASQESTKKKALEREELTRLLEAARTSEDAYHRRLHPLLLFMARMGVRIGEAVGLRWEDLHLSKAEAHVINSISRRRHGTPKSKIGRTIKLSPQVVAMLEQLHADRQIEQLEHGWEAEPQVFVNTAGRYYEASRVSKAFKVILGRATLPQRHSLKTLRHTYASQLIAAGISPAFVQQQLGHASVELTLRVYGAWLPFKGGDAAVALLDDAPVVEKSRMVSPR